MKDNNEIIIYQNESGETRIEVKFTDTPRKSIAG